MKGITRATKIVATLGPATDSPQKIEQLIAAGVDVVRLNFSHGTAKEHIQRASWVHEAAHRLERDVGVAVDLQGPKIRIGKFENGQIELVAGERISFWTLIATWGTKIGWGLITVNWLRMLATKIFCYLMMDTSSYRWNPLLTRKFFARLFKAAFCQTKRN